MPPKNQRKERENVRIITTPSAYGSHSSMVVDIDKEAKNHNVPKDKIICQDEKGYYITYKSRIDNGLADPCRYACPLCRFDNLNIVFSDWKIVQ
jgi:hypothetical protein